MTINTLFSPTSSLALPPARASAKNRPLPSRPFASAFDARQRPSTQALAHEIFPPSRPVSPGLVASFPFLMARLTVIAISRLPFTRSRTPFAPPINRPPQVAAGRVSRPRPLAHAGPLFLPPPPFPAQPPYRPATRRESQSEAPPSRARTDPAADFDPSPAGNLPFRASLCDEITPPRPSPPGSRPPKTRDPSRPSLSSAARRSIAGRQPGGLPSTAACIRNDRPSSEAGPFRRRKAPRPSQPSLMSRIHRAWLPTA